MHIYKATKVKTINTIIIIFAMLMFNNVNNMEVKAAGNESSCNETIVCSEDNSIIKSVPDMHLSCEELCNKYKNKTYREILADYETQGYTREQLDKVCEKCTTLQKRGKLDITEEELILLYTLVFTEAGNQPVETQKLVCSVCINRMYSNRYPDTLEDVIYQQFQFEVVSNGMLFEKMANDTTINAVKDVVEYGVTNLSVTSFRNSYFHEGLKPEFVSGILYFSSDWS